MDINGHLKDVSLRNADGAEGRAAKEESSENDTHSSVHVQKNDVNGELCHRSTLRDG